VVEKAWDRVNIGTYDNAEFARLFTQIGGYGIKTENVNTLVLQKDGQGAEIWLHEQPYDAVQARPPDARSWEPGCYWSLMVRAKNLGSIVEDAAPLGWLPKTPVAYIEFGPSKLDVVVLTHQDTGAQVQFYERLTTPLPETYPDFERFGIPFNIMQIAGDRDASYEFFTQDLGFATWYHGDPYLSEKPEIMPLGIPVELTTRVPYRASIVSPVKDMETGRFEMIEVMGEDAGLTGRNFSDQCHDTSVGIHSVTYVMDSSDAFMDVAGYLDSPEYSGTHANGIRVQAPDGAGIFFVEDDNP